MNIPSRTPGRFVALGVATAALLTLSACSMAGAGPGGAAPTVTVTADPSASGPSASASSDPSASSEPSASGPSASASSDPASSKPAAPDAGSDAGPSSPGSASTGFRAQRCDTADLRGSLQGGEGAAGSTVYDLQLQNTGSHPCTLQGWPGVSLLSTGGSQIGAAADFDRGSVHETVTLLPNGHAHASLKVARAGNYPQAKCSPVHAAQVRVYPPGSRASLTFPARNITGCNSSSVHLLTVQALHATT